MTTDDQIRYVAGAGIVLVQLSFEVFVTLVYLWARALARRAFPRDCSAEARAVIWIIFSSDVFAEMAFINLKFGTSEYWILTLVDLWMLLMRDADLWSDASEGIQKCFGEKLGNVLGLAIELGAGETDLAASRFEQAMDAGETPRQTIRHRLLVMRMVSSQAVVSEFVVTGVFLM